MVGPSSQISKLLLSLLFLLIIFFIYMDVQLYLRIQNYSIERNYHFNMTNQDLQKISAVSSLSEKELLDKINQSTGGGIGGSDGGGIVGIGGFGGLDNGDESNVIEYVKELNDNNKNHELTLTSLSYLSSDNDVILDKNNKDSYYQKFITSSSSSPVIIATPILQIQDSYEKHTWISCDINPLCHVTVKAILLDHTNHYLFAPLATIFDNIIGFSRSRFITANMISYFHVFVACAAARLIASDSLCYRRIGVVLFQFRTFLDDLDGHVARAKRNIRGERSEVGTTGYYIDGICDGLGCIALMIGITFYLKNNPPRRGYTQLQAVIPMTDLKNPDCGVIYKIKITTKKVAKKVLCFSGQLLLSSTAWNRYIALYQDMLERNNVTTSQFIRQNFIFKSNWFFSIAWIWRVFNVHSLLHCVLLSIFCDKLWDFLKMIQYSGYITLLVAICATEMHILEVHNFIFNSLTGNNTSL